MKTPKKKRALAYLIDTLRTENDYIPTKVLLEAIYKYIDEAPIEKVIGHTGCSDGYYACDLSKDSFHYDKNNKCNCGLAIKAKAIRKMLKGNKLCN